MAPAARSCIRAAAAYASTHPGCTMSSASQNANTSPRAARAAALRVAPAPGQAEASITRSAESLSCHAAASSGLPSVEPLSATTTSHAPSCSWRASASSCWPRVDAAFRTGTITLTTGCVIRFTLPSSASGIVHRHRCGDDLALAVLRDLAAQLGVRSGANVARRGTDTERHPPGLTHEPHVVVVEREPAGVDNERDVAARTRLQRYPREADELSVGPHHRCHVVGGVELHGL